MSFGVTTTGFIKKALTDIKSEIEAAQRDALGPTLNLLATSIFGQINGIFADKLRELWDVAEAVYRAFYPSSASGEALDEIAGLTDVVRLEATNSTVTLEQLFLDAGVTVTAGSVVSVGDSGPWFVLLEDVTNSLGYAATFSASAQSVDTGLIVGLAKTIDTIQSPIVGWSAAAAITCATAETYSLDGTSLTLKVDRGSVQTVNFSGGDPWSAADTATEIVSQTSAVDASDEGGKVRLYSLTEGTGSAFEVTGGTANAVLNFSTDEVKGFNTLDAELGTNEETDAELRLRRDELLRAIGAGTLEAIRANVRALDDVEQVIAVENVELTTSPEGLPGKSFEVIVIGGDNQENADTIRANKPAGIESYGSESETVTDSQGYTHTIEFSRPTEVPLYVELTITTDPALYPADGDDQVKAALVAKAQAQDIGEDVIALQFKCAPLEVAGVEDVTIFKIDDVDPPVGTGNISILFRELATLQSTDIDVTVT